MITDNDLVSRCQRNHIQQPAPQRVRGGREGEGGGADNDLLSRGQHDHIQSPAPQPTGLQTTLLEVVSFFVGGCFMCPEQGTGEGGEGGLGVYRHLTQAGFAHKGGGPGRGGLGGQGIYRQASDPKGGFPRKASGQLL